MGFIIVLVMNEDTNVAYHNVWRQNTTADTVSILLSKLVCGKLCFNFA